MVINATIQEQAKTATACPAPANTSFWQRRLMDPLKQQITQGATPEKLAQSVAWGALLGIFPILGTTTMLCGAAGIVLRLNHIAMQTVNWLVYPLQFLCIIPFLRLGNIIFGFDPIPLSITEITALFEADFWGSLQNMGWLALRGIVAWMLVATPSILLIRFTLTPMFTRLARSLPRKDLVS
jgi:uncharacterized protein (DUF2062 family)